MSLIPLISKGLKTDCCFGKWICCQLLTSYHFWKVKLHNHSKFSLIPKEECNNPTTTEIGRIGSTQPFKHVTCFIRGRGEGLDQMSSESSFTFTRSRTEHLTKNLCFTSHLYQSAAQGKHSLRGVTSSTASLVFPVALNLTSPIPAKHNVVQFVRSKPEAMQDID